MISCYGEALVDLIIQLYEPGAMRTSAQACLGGSVFNFCIAAQRQGLQTRYLNALSSDSFGRQFAHILQSEGVLLAHGEPTPEPSSIAVVQLDKKGTAAYAFHRESVADIVRTAPEIIAKLNHAEVLHTGCLMLVPSAWANTQNILLAARRQGSFISVDANMRTSVYPDLAAYRPCVMAACAMANIVKVSDDDLIALGLLHAPDANNETALRNACHAFFQASHTQLIALTLGAQGAWLVTRFHSEKAEPPKNLQVADTVGAGDSFFAALLAHLSRHQALANPTSSQMQAALHHAVVAASICVEKVGCDPATWQETISRSQYSERSA